MTEYDSSPNISISSAQLWSQQS